MTRLVPGQVVFDAVRMGVQPGQKGCPTRRAEGRAREGVEEAGPLVGHAVDVRRLDERMSTRAEVVPPHVIDKNHDHVRRGHGLIRTTGKEEPAQ